MKPTGQYKYKHVRVNDGYHLVQNKRWCRRTLVEDDRLPAYLEVTSLERPGEFGAKLLRPTSSQLEEEEGTKEFQKGLDRNKAFGQRNELGLHEKVRNSLFPATHQPANESLHRHYSVRKNLKAGRYSLPGHGGQQSNKALGARKASAQAPGMRQRAFQIKTQGQLFQHDFDSRNSQSLS